MPYCASCVVQIKTRHQLHHTHALKTDYLLRFRSVPLKPSGPQQLPIVTHSLGQISAPSCGNIMYLLDAGPTVCFPEMLVVILDHLCLSWSLSLLLCWFHSMFAAMRRGRSFLIDSQAGLLVCLLLFIHFPLKHWRLLNTYLPFCLRKSQRAVKKG